MEKNIKELLSLLKRERVLITKMVDADEREDKLLFNSLQSIYKDTSLKVDELLKELIKDDTYNNSIELLSIKINDAVDNQKTVDDLVTLLGLVNTFYMNRMSNEMVNCDSDVFSNELNTQIYDIYLWLISNNDYTKEFKDAIRIDLVNKLVNSRSMRKYFAGFYEEAAKIADPIIEEDKKDRNRLGMNYASMMMAQIGLSNKFEMYEGELDEVSFDSRRKMLEIEFAAISKILERRGFLIPPNTMDYSDFTEQVMRDASKLYNEYHEKKKKEQTKILIK